MSDPSSAIGSFVIGESPIERSTAPTFDVIKTVISQYGNSPILLSLVNTFAEAINPDQNIGDFYDKVLNIVTAQGWGLDVWGRIVGVSRVLQLPAVGDFFGFAEATDAEPFGQEAFYSPNTHTTDNFRLSDEAYRTLILVKALTNISRTTIPVMNSVLMSLFPGRGNAYVSDDGNMTETILFEFPLQPFEVAILLYSGAFATPTGVEFNIIIVVPDTFGFAEADTYEGFGNGTYFGGFL